jgi:uncharacterized membrane protein
MPDETTEVEDKTSDDQGPAEEPASDDAAPSALDVAKDVEILQGEILEDLSDPKIQNALSRIAAFSLISESSTGVLPPPSFVERYEQIYPGAAGLFFAAYEQQQQQKLSEQQHRHRLEQRALDLEEKALDSGIERAKKGQMIGLVLSVLFLAATLFVMYYGMKTDHERVAITGGIAIVTAIAGLVVIFLREESGVSKELADKRRAETGDDDQPSRSPDELLETVSDNATESH